MMNVVIKMLGCAIGGLLISQSALAVKVGDVLPKLTVKAGDGTMAQPWSGKPALINFWATWCESCKVELKEMADELKKKPDSAAVVFVSLDKESAKAKDWMAREFKDQSAMVENLFYDESFKLADTLGVESFPMTLVVDAQGKVLKIQDGFKEGTGSTAALFDELRAAASKK